MATTWKLTLVEDDKDTAQWVHEEICGIIDGLEEDLSRFQPTSYIAQLARLPAGASFGVNPAVIEILNLAQAMHRETFGAFDISVRPAQDGQAWPSMMDGFEAEAESLSVLVKKPDLKLDLGGIGKGFAIDEIIEWLQSEAEVEHAFIDAGGSTMYALGNCPEGEAEGWPVNLGPETIIALSGQALSASGFEVQGYHVTDPRTGLPAGKDRKRSWVFAQSAALADALSTAALVMTTEEIDQFSLQHPEMTLMLV